MNGFIIDGVSKIVDILQKISAVEIYKEFRAKKYSGANIIACKNNAIDTFIIFKWTLLILIFIFNLRNIYITSIVSYLLIMNIHTYMFYHLWEQNNTRDIFHMRRRFIALLQSFGFNCLSFSYFYRLSNIFTVPIGFSGKYSQNSMAIIHSIYSSFTNGSPFIEPICTLGFVIQVLHIITTFLFLSVLLSRV